MAQVRNIVAAKIQVDAAERHCREAVRLIEAVDIYSPAVGDLEAALELIEHANRALAAEGPVQVGG